MVEKCIIAHEYPLKGLAIQFNCAAKTQIHFRNTFSKGHTQFLRKVDGSIYSTDPILHGFYTKFNLGPMFSITIVENAQTWKPAQIRKIRICIS